MSSTSVWGSLKSLWSRRELVRRLVVYDLKQVHTNMVLGHLWWILNPIFNALVYWFLLVFIFGVGKDNYILFLLLAIVPFRAFSTAVSQSVTCISGKEGLIKQVAFPKTVFPVSTVLAQAFQLIPGFAVLVVACAIFAGPITPHLLALPAIVAVQLTLTAGMCFLVAVAGLYFADLQNMMQFIMRLWLYLSPALYSLERIPERLQTVFMMNPLAPIFIGYRNVIMYGRPPDWQWLGVAFLTSSALLFVGFALFSAREPRMAKLV
ncbi:MAG: ABC transporter permease [Planctomycetota bacterium]